MNNPRVQLSWMFLVGGALAGAELVRQGIWLGSPLVVIPGSGYAAWSLYWGWPVFADWFRRSEKFSRSLHFRGDNSLAMVLGLLLVRVSLLLTVWVYYSLLGGGIFQFWRALRGHHGHT